MKFFKDNGHIVSRLVITHIAMTVFGLVLFLATQNIENPTAVFPLIVGIFSAVFFCALTYAIMWDIGAKDKASYDAGRRTSPAKRAFLSSLVAEAFWILLAVMYLSLYFTVGENIASVFYAVETVTSSCFNGIVINLINQPFANGNVVLQPFLIAGVYILGSLAVCGASTLGYFFGTKDINLIPKSNNQKK